MSIYEWWATIIAGATALINLGALGFVGLQVRHATKESQRAALDQQAEWCRQRKHDTISAATLTSQYREELKSKLPWNDRDTAQVKIFLDNAESDDAVKRAIKAYLDYLEMLAVGMNEGVLELSTLARMTGGRIVAVATNYAPYIERRRTELNTVTLYSELEQLAQSVQKYRQSAR